MNLEEDFRRLATGFIDGSSVVGQDPNRLDLGVIQGAAIADPAFDSARLLEELASTQTLHNQEDFFIPEFPQEVSPSSDPQFLRYKEDIGSGEKIDTTKPGAVWRGTNVAFERTPEGQVIVTELKNIPKQTAPASSAPGTIPGAIQEGIKKLSSIQDPTARADLYGSLVTEANNYKLALKSETIRQREVALGIPRLEEALLVAEQKDLQNPDPMFRGVDSQPTAFIRKQLMDRRTQATKEAEDQLSRNFSIAALNTQMSVAEDLYTRATKLTDQRETANINRTAAQQMRADEEARQEAVKVKELVQSTPPEKLARYTYLFPSLNGTPTENVVRAVLKEKDKEVHAVLAASDGDDLLNLAFLEGNTKAEKAFIAEEAAKTSQAPEVIQRDLAKLRKLMSDDKALNTAALALGGKDAADALSSAKRLAIGSKDAAKTYEASKYQIARAAIQKEREGAFLNDVGSWGLVDLELDTATKKAKELSGKADTLSVFDSYVGDLRGQARADKEREFYLKLMASADKYKGSTLGAMDPLALKLQVEALRAAQLAEQLMPGPMNSYKNTLALAANAIPGALGTAAAGSILQDTGIAEAIQRARPALVDFFRSAQK